MGRVINFLFYSSNCKIQVASSKRQVATAETDCLRSLISAECKIGRYSITLSFLDLFHTLLVFARKWRVPEMSTNGNKFLFLIVLTALPLSALICKYIGGVPPITAESFHPYLNFIKTELFVHYDTWRYKEPHQKNKIGIKVLLFLKDCSVVK